MRKLHNCEHHEFVLPPYPLVTNNMMLERLQIFPAIRINIILSSAPKAFRLIVSHKSSTPESGIGSLSPYPRYRPNPSRPHIFPFLTIYESCVNNMDQSLVSILNRTVYCTKVDVVYRL